MSLGGIEGRYLDARGAELLQQAAAGEGPAAYLVVKQEHPDAVPCLVSENAPEPTSQLIVADNVELEKNVFLRGFQSFQYAVESLLAVHQ